MAQDNQNISVGKKGMNRDTHPSNLQETEYTIALNANLEDTSGNGYPMLQNEHSNILCSRFVEGFKVIGMVNDLNEDKTYYFLTNPSTGLSEIGYISNVQNITTVEDVEADCGCGIANKLAEPLEDTTQEETCTYVKIIDDACNGCLNFSIDYPIKEKNIHLKDEKCGKRIYWTDNNNRQRYIDLSNLEQYLYVGDPVCDEVPVPTCLDCDKLDIFQSFEKPCITPKVIQYGGNLRKGTYEFLVAYCDKGGNEISEYYSITNPISIFDENNVRLDQTELDARTNLGIRLQVDGLDTKYGYYKVAVIQVADVNGAVSYFEEGVHPTTDNNVFYTTDADAKRTTLQKLLAVKPVYTKAEGMATSNGYLFQYGLEAQKEMNLQPVVNLMGAFLRWNTVIADEYLYKDGVNNSLFRGYMRDEVYPFSIRFSDGRGFTTANFPFINRPPTVAEETPVAVNNDSNSINEFAPNCSDTGRTKHWQFYNTASSLGTCPSGGLTLEEIVRTITKYCIVDSVATIPSGTVTIPDGTPFTTLENYLNDYADEICNVSSEHYDVTLCGYLSDTYPASNCDPNFGANCAPESLLDETVIVQEVTNEQLNYVEKAVGDYSRIAPPAFCDIYEPDTASGGILRDTDFEKEFMVSDTSSGSRVYQTVYDRKDVGANDNCTYADELYVVSDPATAVGLSRHLDYYGADTLPPLQLPQTSTCIDAAFTSFVHIGALWFKGDFGTRDKLIVEMTPNTLCNEDDDIPQDNRLRLNFYDSCSDTIPVYCTIVDMSTGDLFELDATLFAGTEFYFTVDAPIVTENSDGVNITFEINDQPTKYRTAPVCGCFAVYLREVEYESLEVDFDSITLGKQQRYTADCTFQVPIFDGCNPIPFEYGKFGYWESTENYPDNAELYDSSTLDINQSDIPAAIQTEFEDYFVDSTDVDGNYTLNNNTDFKCKPIRHYKFPDAEVSPFMTTDLVSPFQRSLIFPIGVSIDVDIINAFLDLAVKQGLISQEERDSLTKYEIFRGDRTLNKSVIAKGLLYDTYSYDEEGEDVLYPNYPYNDLGDDILNFDGSDRANFIPHPFDGDSNNRFTFHSPDVHFRKPTLPSEVNIEGYQYGTSRGVFDDVDGHSEWVILGDDAYTTATALALAEIAFEAAIKLGELTVLSSQGYWFVGGFTNGTGAAGAGIGTGIAIGVAAAMVVDGVMRAGRYRYEWLENFKNLGQPKNFASYYTSEGFYNYFAANTDIGNKLRGLASRKYLKSGRYSITEDNTGVKVNFNNFNRESSVFLSFGDTYNFSYDATYKAYDNYNVDNNSNSRTTSSESFSCTSGRTREIERNIASPYVSLKDYIPNQYGDIEGVKWIPTGFCGDLDYAEDECQVVFGGDIFISRFSLKRKTPLFLANANDLAPRTPFNYYDYRNIGYPKYYCNYDTETDTTVLGSLFPDVQSEYTMDCETGSTKFYLRRPSKFYLYYYGIPQFLVESEINVNYRYAGKTDREDFYPNYGDYVDWTQEKNVSIKEDNVFNYNSIYSKNTTRIASRMLPATFDSNLYDCLYDAPNGVIYSLQDNSEQDITDPWLIYRPLDFYQFPTSAGKLMDLRGIESTQVLGRFTNQVILFNAIDTIRDRLTPETQDLGNAGIFATRPLEWKKTDLGYAGTQHKAMVSCEFGHFWTDAKRGQVFQVDQNGKNLREITKGVRNWFKEHLPFKILKTNNENLTYEDLDNNFKGIGITMGWDSRFKRVLLTKKDYIALKPIFTQDNQIYSVEFRDTTIATYTGLGYTYEGIVNGQMVFTIEVPTPLTVNVPIESLYFNNTEFFKDVSFTIGYSPLMEGWISYYSYTPDFYVNHHNYFQTGLNFSSDSTEEGLWSHLLTNKSFKVFYGKKYPWMVELPIKENYVNKILKNVEYWIDSRRYHNEFDYAEKRDLGFNKAWIYNTNNNSGQLNLITEQKNNQYQKLQYPKLKLGAATDILATQSDKKWTFNDFYNYVDNDLTNVPLWNYDENAIHKTLNNKAFKFNRPWKDRLRGDWFLLRLQEDEETRFKQIFKWSTAKESIYI